MKRLEGIVTALEQNALKVDFVNNFVIERKTTKTCASLWRKKIRCGMKAFEQYNVLKV